MLLIYIMPYLNVFLDHTVSATLKYHNFVEHQLSDKSYNAHQAFQRMVTILYFVIADVFYKAIIS